MLRGIELFTSDQLMEEARLLTHAEVGPLDSSVILWRNLFS